MHGYKVFQDGADFYRDSDGAHIWSAPFKVRDCDMTAAEKARSAFLAWCAELCFIPEFAQ